MRNKALSFRIIPKIVFLIAIVGAVMIIYDQQSQNFQNNETSFFKKSQLKPNKLFYTEWNEKCVQACTEVGGVSCGKINKNCCTKKGCLSKVIGDYCTEYIAIIGCTSPS